MFVLQSTLLEFLQKFHLFPGLSVQEKKILFPDYGLQFVKILLPFLKSSGNYGNHNLILEFRVDGCSPDDDGIFMTLFLI